MSKRLAFLSRFRTLRLWRRRATIAAPKMSIKTHVPWYLRGALWISFVVIGYVAAQVIYNEGRKIAGFSADQVQDELKSQRAKIDELTQENKQLTAQANGASSKIQIEQTAREQVSQQIKVLETDNARLKEELAYFDSVFASGKPQSALAINGFKVERDPVLKQYRYRLMLTRDARQGGFGEGKAAPEFEGQLQFVIVTIEDGKPVTRTLPSNRENREPNKDGNDAFRLRFKFVERAQGVLTVPDNATIRQVQVKVLESNGTVRATQTINL